MKEDIEKVEQEKDKWQKNAVSKTMEKYRLKENPSRFYTPDDIKDFDFLENVGFPGQYPLTAGNDIIPRWQAFAKKQALASTKVEFGASSGGRYAGFGLAEDYRDYLIGMHKLGQKAGPTIAFDLPTQCGLDSDDPRAEGEVGKVGVAVDSFKDFETIYEPYVGDIDLDKISSNYTINAPACILLSMYIALAQKRGIDITKLRCTPQNDILKEYVGRGTYIFPPKPALRLFRDVLVFCSKNLPKVNITSIGGYHMREAGASREQDLAFSMAIGAAYLQTGIDAGLGIDEFAPRFSFNAFGGSMEIYKEIAFQRAARRAWARMLKERFGAKNPRSLLIRQVMGAHIGCSSATLQRPINNQSRAVVGGIASAMSGSIPFCYPPYDEALGLGHSPEAIQLTNDASRILIYECKLGEVIDPWAGSYFMEKLTDDIEAGAQAEYEKIEKMGGAVAAVDNGYIQKSIAQSAHERQRKIERMEEFVVGVNCFNSPNELNVETPRHIEAIYSPELKESAGERQVEKNKRLKEERDNKLVAENLKKLKATAQDESKSVMPDVLECVKSYATLQEMCDVLRDVFGEYQATTI